MTPLDVLIWAVVGLIVVIVTVAAVGLIWAVVETIRGPKPTIKQEPPKSNFRIIKKD